MGKLLYMAPELFDCGHPLMCAADVWALGIILFLLLTGMPPWDAATGPVATDLRFVTSATGGCAFVECVNIASEHARAARLLTADPDG